MEITCAAWLLREFRNWEASTGSRQTVSAFARYLGVKQPSLNRWMNGDTEPDMENVIKLSQKLGMEIYTVLGLPVPPGPDHSDDELKLLANYRNASPEKRAKLLHYSELLDEEDIGSQSAARLNPKTQPR